MLHVDVGPGEVANRVVTVGTPERAAILAGHLDGAGGKDPKGARHPPSSTVYTLHYFGVGLLLRPGPQRRR